MEGPIPVETLFVGARADPLETLFVMKWGRTRSRRVFGFGNVADPIETLSFCLFLGRVGGLESHRDGFC